MMDFLFRRRVRAQSVPLRDFEIECLIDGRALRVVDVRPPSPVPPVPAGTRIARAEATLAAWAGGLRPDMSPPGRPKGEHRKAQPEGSPVNLDTVPFAHTEENPA